MIKYEVYKEKEIEVRTHDRNWTVEDILNHYHNKGEFYRELLKSFDTLEEAKEFFESEKQYCQTTHWYHHSIIQGLHYDVLALDEVEYDEDGEYIQGDCYYEYVVPYHEEY